MNPLSLTPDILPEMIGRLTPRQMEIVGLLAQGENNRRIATLLSIGVPTIKGHVHRACHKLNLDNRIQLVVVYAMYKALENGKV
jgi:DNA-binding NarL/FixJ family response regulator